MLLPEGLDVDVEQAPSRQEVRHRFTLSMLSEIPSDVPAVGGVKVSGIVALESGRHYNIFVGRLRGVTAAIDLFVSEYESELRRMAADGS